MNAGVKIADGIPRCARAPEVVRAYLGGMMLEVGALPCITASTWR
jgi:hypothetical protein